MKLHILFISFFVQNFTIAQTSTSLDIRLPTEIGYGSVKYNNPSEIGRTTNIEVNNEEIAGTAFWRNDWNKAYVFLTSGGIVRLSKAKFNFQTNEIYFLDSANVLKAVDESLINRIIFIDKNDSVKTLAVFQKLHYDGNDFFQVFNAGNYQLLKAVKVSVIKRDYNALLGKDEYAFESKPVYYLFHDGQFSKIDVLNREQLTAHVKISVANNTWLDQNKNRLKSESDWVSFLNYYNSKQ